MEIFRENWHRVQQHTCACTHDFFSLFSIDSHFVLLDYKHKATSRRLWQQKRERNRCACECVYERYEWRLTVLWMNLK
jgi:hypothetical protein